MVKITHIFKTYFPDTQGGLEEAIRQIAKFSVRSGYYVSVVSVSKSPSEGMIDGIFCKSYKQSFNVKSNPFSKELLFNYRDVIKNTDILHLHFPWPTGELLTLLNNVNKPIVITFHCDIHNSVILKTLYRPFMKKIFMKASVVVPTSSNLLNSASFLKDFKDKCEVISLWLDDERFQCLGNPDENMKKFILNIGDYSLFIGVLRWYKGLDVVLDCAKNVSGNIVIVGKGPLMQKLKNEIQKRSIKNVHLLGYQSDSNVKYLIEKSRSIILPSTSPAEAFGQTLLEASYFKKPMITTELGTGTSFVNLDKVTGYVIEANNSLELSSAINKMFLDDTITRNFGANAYNRYLNLFTEKIQGPKYIDIYNRLTK